MFRSLSCELLYGEFLVAGVDECLDVRCAVNPSIVQRPDHENLLNRGSLYTVFFLRG